MDMDWKFSVFVFILGIPGVLCKDNYDVGGMVAAAAAGVLFLTAAILMGVVICLWPEYYHKQQLLRGKKRVPRPKRKKWLERFRSTKYTASTVLTHPRSEHKQNLVPMYQIDGTRGSRSSTFQGRVRAEKWMQNLPYTSQTHETKSKTINIEAEEDPPIIIADVLPAGTTETIATARTYGYADATPRSIGETQYTTTETGRTQYITADTSRAQYITADTDRTQHTTTDADTLQPIHIKLETRGNFITSDLGSSQLRTTQLGSSQLRTTQLRSTQVTNEPVHIHTGQTSDDIVITPVVASNGMGFRESYAYHPQELRQTTQSLGRQPSPEPAGEDEAVVQFDDNGSH